MPDKGGARPCPKCTFEGKMHELSDPYLTEEGWVQDCPVHGRLYLWGHWAIQSGASPVEGPKVRCFICDKEMKLLYFNQIPYWQCPGDPLHRLSLPEWSVLAGGFDVKDELRHAMEKRAEFFTAQLRAGDGEKREQGGLTTSSEGEV